MKSLPMPIVILFSCCALYANPPSKTHENSVVDRADGIALKLTVQPYQDRSGNKTKLVSISLKNEVFEEWGWSGDRMHKVGKVPQLREIFSVSLLDENGKECELTSDGKKHLRLPKGKDSYDSKGYVYPLKKGDGFDWQVDLLKCFKVTGGEYAVVIKAWWRGNTGWRDLPEGGSEPIGFKDDPNVRIAGKRVTIPAQKRANKTE